MNIQTLHTFAQQLLSKSNPMTFLDSFLMKPSLERESLISFWRQSEMKLQSMASRSTVAKSSSNQTMIDNLQQQYARMCEHIDSDIDPELLHHAAEIAARCNVKAAAILQEIEELAVVEDLLI